MGDIVKTGSVADIARRTGMPLARAWMDVELIILLDVSGSMQETDGTPFTRIERAQRAVEDVLARHPGRVAIILFGERARLNLDGVLPSVAVDRSTLLAPALRLLCDVAPRATGMRGLIVTDGELHDESDAISVASACIPCDGMYIGRSDDVARRALERVCRATGGGGDITAAPVTALSAVAHRMLPLS